MPEVAVRPDFRLSCRQTHRPHDLVNDQLLLQNATIGVECEPLCLCVVDDPATRGLFIFHVTRHGSETLLRRPIVVMALSVAQTIPIRLRFAERAGIEDKEPRSL